MASKTIQNNVFTFVESFNNNLDFVRSEIKGFKESSNVDTITNFNITYNMGKKDEFKVAYKSFKEAEEIIKIGTEFITLFKNYLVSDSSTGSKLEKMIVELILEGTSEIKVEETLNIAPSTRRTCVARFTKKINSSIWGNSPIPNELFYLKNVIIFKRYIKKLKVATVMYDFKEILPYNFLSLIKAKCNDCESIEKYDVFSEEYYKAFRLVTMFSLATFEEELEKVDKYALQFVLDALSRKGNNITSVNFKTVMSNPSQWLMSSPTDFRDMLIENKSLFSDDEEKKKSERYTIEKEVFNKELTPINSQYYLPITEEMADYMSKRLNDFKKLKNVHIEKWRKVCNAGVTEERSIKVMHFFENIKSISSLDEFKLNLNSLNIHAVGTYIEKHSLRK